VTHDDDEESKISKALDATEVVVDDERWRHVLDRHPELKEMLHVVNEAISAPDEAFVDVHGAVHLVKRLRSGPSDFLVTVVRRSGPKVHLITAYCTNEKRKERRYRKFKKLALS